MSTRHVGFTVDSALYESLKKLARHTGVSINFAIRRAVIEMINIGVIPMPGTVRPEEAAALRETAPQMEQAKRIKELEDAFGELQEKLAEAKAGTTFTFDGTRVRTKEAKDGRKSAASRAV